MTFKISSPYISRRHGPRRARGARHRLIRRRRHRPPPLTAAVMPRADVPQVAPKLTLRQRVHHVGMTRVVIRHIAGQAVHPAIGVQDAIFERR